MKILLTIFFVFLFLLCGFSLYCEDTAIKTLLVTANKALEENKTEEALISLDAAVQIAESEKDPQACLEIALLYEKLPAELERKEFAIDILEKGAVFAEQQKKLPLLWEFAGLLMEFGRNDSAIRLYDQLFIEAGQEKDKYDFIALKGQYEKLGDQERVALCDKMIKIISIPPANWPLVGETIRGPKQTSSPQVQQYNRQLADQEIHQTVEHLQEKRQLEEDKKKRTYPDNGYYPY